MLDALYVRQSVERADSVSIESQLTICRFETKGNPYREYVDRGFSGKDTHRPGFEALIRDIRKGEIGRVIVYKLDRISRSLSDFSRILELFRENNVEFLSSTERFDTSVPMGRAMMSLCAVFAQLERETIQQRVADAYASRCRMGLYMGGKAPYGFRREDAVLHGISSARLFPIPEETEQIRRIYALYSDPRTSLGDLLRRFSVEQIPHLRGGSWNAARLSELLKNPVYARSNEAVRTFFEKQDAKVIGSPADFEKGNGCYLYHIDGGQELVSAPHEGIVEPSLWLACREKLLSRRHSASCSKGQSSWLTGKVKCAICGSAMVIVRSNTRWQRYFVCSAALQSKRSRCPGMNGTVYAKLLEDHLARKMKERLQSLLPNLKSPVCFQSLSLSQKKAVTDALIRRITVGDGTIAVFWNL